MLGNDISDFMQTAALTSERAENMKNGVYRQVIFCIVGFDDGVLKEDSFAMTVRTIDVSEAVAGLLEFFERGIVDDAVDKGFAQFGFFRSDLFGAVGNTCDAIMTGKHCCGLIEGDAVEDEVVCGGVGQFFGCTLWLLVLYGQPNSRHIRREVRKTSER